MKPFLLERIILFLVFIFFPINLKAQYSSFDSIPSHAIGGGLASSGVGFKEESLNLITNPSFLAGRKDIILDVGGLIPYQGNQSGIAKPSSMGAFIPINSNSGWGISGRLDYHSGFPDEYRFSFFSGQFFYSRMFADRYFLSAGVGPASGFRVRQYSKIGLSPFLSGGLELGKFTIGAKIYSPGNLYEFKLYRGSDDLKQRLPPIITLGLTYSISENLAVYSEIKRILYERSTFDLNGENSKPDLERGIGAELKSSVGISFTMKEESILKFRSGLELGGKYDEKGKNLRGNGIGFGVGYIPSTTNKGFEINMSIFDYSLLSPKNGYPSETIFYLNLGYKYE